MIVTFSIENFLSFNEEVTFSLVASNRLSDHHENHLVQIPRNDAKVLRGGIMYGANGAGKSNFFKALSYLRDTALKRKKTKSEAESETESESPGTGRTAFRFREDPEMPSHLDLQFIVRDTLYRFGLILDDERIIEEWLFEVNGSRKKVIYERKTDEKGNVTVKIRGASPKLKALAIVGGPKEQSFLATIRSTLDRNDHGPVREVIDWFRSGIRFISPNSHYYRLGHKLSIDNELRSFSGDFLRAASTGVDDLHVSREEISEDQLKAMLPPFLAEEIIADINKGEFGVLKVNNAEIVVEKAGEHRYHILSIQSIHEHEMSEKVRFDVTEESDGTRRLLHLLPALHHLHTDGGVFVIDEVERSMHPLLVRKFLEFFFNDCDGDRRQLIVTSHESNLLDQDLLRRDEIWFAEKNQRGATSLYSLADFQPRRDLKIDKHYLRGRFGAIPFLGEINKITNDKEV